MRCKHVCGFGRHELVHGMWCSTILNHWCCLVLEWLSRGPVSSHSIELHPVCRGPVLGSNRSCIFVNLHGLSRGKVFLNRLEHVLELPIWVVPGEHGLIELLGLCCGDISFDDGGLVGLHELRSGDLPSKRGCIKLCQL